MAAIAALSPAAAEAAPPPLYTVVTARKRGRTFAVRSGDLSSTVSVERLDGLRLLAGVVVLCSIVLLFSPVLSGADRGGGARGGRPLLNKLPVR